MPENKNTLSTPDIQRLLQEYQSGVEALQDIEFPKFNQPSRRISETNGLPVLPTYAERNQGVPFSSYVGEEHTEEARQAGMGLSRYDMDYTPGMDVEDSRAKLQSGFAKIGSGLLKGGVTAVSTALNTTVGTVFGLGSALFELAADANGNGRSIMDTLDAGVNNWLSNQTVKLQNFSEELFPNYRTAEERSEKYQREWWKHMGTANFIGDSFLKNFGFTVGAMAGGMAWTKLIGAGLSKQLAGDIMKGAVAAAEGDAEAGTLLKEAADAIAAGRNKAARKAMSGAVERANAIKNASTATVNTDVVVSNVKNASRALNKYGAKMGLYGAVIGAMGEGTVEGIMARNEFTEDVQGRIQNEFAREYDNLENDIKNSGNWSWLVINTEQGPDGQFSGKTELSEEGRMELARRQQETVNKYRAMMQQSEVEADRLASTTYLLNLPILTTSNVVQFGRMLSGGWTTAKNVAASGVKGGLRIAAGEKGALKLASDYASRFGKGAIAGKTVLNALRNAGTEAFEEMSQGAVSAGSQRVADNNLTAFNDAGFDAEAIGSVRDWFTGMLEGGSEYLGDVKNWQEGALGALTGLFGIPGRRWSGGIAEAYREARDEVNESRTAANRLNTTVNSEEFQTRWNNYIRHLAFDNAMDEALQKNDQYAWKSVNDAQLINDIMMFADAGKLEDLEQMVDAMGSISEDQAQEIINMSKDENGNLPPYLKNKSKADMVASVKKQAEDIKDKIKQYKEFYDALSTRLPIDIKKEERERLLKEMTFTAQQMKGFESRYLRMLDEVIDAVMPVETDEQRAAREPVAAAIRRAFSSGAPIVAESIETAKNMETLLDGLEDIAKETKDEGIQQKLKDMRKLSEDRRAFYRKLTYLQTEEGQDAFNENVTTQKKINEASDEAAKRVETKDYKTVADVKKAYYDLKGSTGNVAAARANFIEELRKTKGANKAVDDFVELYDAANGFRTKAMAAQEDFLESIGNPVIPWIKSVYGRMVTSLLSHNVNSIEDLQRLDPDAFDTSSEMTKHATQQSSFMPPSESAVAQRMAEIQEFLRGVMEEYFKEKNSASIAKSKKKIKSEKKDSGKSRIPKQAVDKLGFKREEPEQPEQSPQPAPAAAPEPIVEEYDDERKRVEGEEDKRGRDVRPTQGELNDIAVPPMPEPAEMDKAASKTDGKRRYYRPAFAEVSVERLKNRRAAFEEEQTTKRDAILASPDAQLIEIGEDKGTSERPMPKSKAGEGEVNDFSKITRALKARGAFDNMSLIRKGDKIKFVIYQNEDPQSGGFPMIDGRRVVLMCVEKTVGGQKQLLVVNAMLDDSEKNEKEYFGLASLYESILDELGDRGFDENGVFVFSKESPVWALRSGFIDYGPTNEDHSLTGLPGYDKKAPIIFVGQNGEITYMTNEPKGGPIDKKFGNIADLFPKKAQSELSSYSGNFYYLAYDNDGYKVPIRLGQEHFKPETMNGTSAPFVALRDAVKKIITVVQNAEKNVPADVPVQGETVEDRDKRKARHNNVLSKYRKDLSKHIRELDAILDLHRDSITLGFNAEDGKISLKITPDFFSHNEDEKTKRAPMYFYEDTLTLDEVLKGLASLDRAFNVSSDETSTSITRKVNDGILTTNARKLRQVGIDFYTFPWFPGAGKDGAFMSGSTRQAQIQKSEYEEDKSVIAQEKPNEEPAAPVKKKSKFKKGNMEFQITGTRPSAISQETRARIEEAKKESKKRRAAVKSELYNQLRKANSISNMRMNDRKLRKKLLDLGLAASVVDYITTGIQQYPHLRDMTPYEAFVQLDSMVRYDIADEYNKSLGKQLDQKLNDFLMSFLAKYGITTRTGDLSEMFGEEGVAGAYDVIEKIIWLNENPDMLNKITYPEEFAHAFVELMGSSIGYGADSDDFKFLYETVTDTKIYQQVYEKYKDIYKDEDGKPDEYRIRKEAIGQALAAGIVHNWEQADERKEDGGFFQRLKNWFQQIINLFKGANITFEQTIDDIAKEILAGDTRRLKKVDDEGYNLLDYAETLRSQTERDGGKAVDFMRWFSSIGNIITGSLAYRRQGTVYRSKLDSLHDIDMIVPDTVHGIHTRQVLLKYDYRIRNNQNFMNEVLSSPYFKEIKKQYPKIEFIAVYNDGNDITVNSVYSEDPSLTKRFASLSGKYSERLEHFTEEERSQIYLFDFFLREPGHKDEFAVDEESGLTLGGYANAFREKLKMGRSKDIYDYQRWRLFDEFQGRRSDPRDILYQATSVDYGEEALKMHKEQVMNEVSETSGVFEEDRENIASALTVISSKGPVAVERTRLALDNWSRSGVSLSQDMEDFSYVFNSIFTDTEKRRIADVLESAYGMPANEISVSKLNEDYVLWKLSGIIRGGTEEDKAEIRRAFERMQSLETSHKESANLLSRTASIVGTRKNRESGIQIGMIPDVSKFANLSEETKQGLLDRMWTEEEYNSAPEDIRDKALRCIGV